MAARANVIPLLLTVDTEPDWGVSGTRSIVEILPRLLDEFEARCITATFFVTGDLARSRREHLLRIGGHHEIASHCQTHRRMDKLTREELREELRLSKSTLEQELGRSVSGVRAPFFATPEYWLDETAAAGYDYDASAGCVRPALRNRKWPKAEAGMERLGVSVLKDGLTPLCLTYLRLYHPFGLWMMPGPGVERPTMMYLHLHEFLPAEAAGSMSALLSTLLTRNCGEAAWGILRRALDRLKGEWMTCSGYIANSKGCLEGDSE